MKYIIIILKSYILLITSSPLLAYSKGKSKTTYNLKELALPSEVKDLAKVTGSIYYSPSVKDKVLIPVHIWGEIGMSGLHFLPIETTLINGLSLAGGPKNRAEMNEIKLSRKENGKIKEYQFDLTSGGDLRAFSTTLKAGDTIFVPQSNYFQDRSYYTSLFGVIATVLSSILLYRQVRKNN